MLSYIPHTTEDPPFSTEALPALAANSTEREQLTAEPSL